MAKRKNTAIANDLLDELLEDSVVGGKSSDSDVHESAIHISMDDSDAEFGGDFEFGEVSQTRPNESGDEKTEKFGDQINEEEGTMPISQMDEVGEPSFAPSRAAVGRSEGLRSSGMAGSTEAVLAHSENLRLAQNRILDLEKEIERLRSENEALGAAGETLRRRADELLSSQEQLERKLEHEISTSNQEKEIFKNSRDLLRKEVEELKQKNSELELRISTNIQRVRVRERELENRLELMKVESQALIRSKDEMILDLKRQIDQLNLELNNYRVKSQDLNKQIFERQETLRRTVKALRLALSMMEGEESIPLKKAK